MQNEVSSRVVTIGKVFGCCWALCCFLVSPEPHRIIVAEQHESQGCPHVPAILLQGSNVLVPGMSHLYEHLQIYGCLQMEVERGCSK